MKFKATLTKKTTDYVKSSLLSPHQATLIFDVYSVEGKMAEEFAELIKVYFDSEFEIEIK